jgi:hypothetical protein
MIFHALSVLFVVSGFLRLLVSTKLIELKYKSVDVYKSLS